MAPGARWEGELEAEWMKKRVGYSQTGRCERDWHAAGDIGVAVRFLHSLESLEEQFKKLSVWCDVWAGWWSIGEWQVH